MKDAHSVILCPIRTEKGTGMLPFNKYVFWVGKKTNKIEIRNAVEEIYKVKVARVNTLTSKAKNKRVRYVEGKTSEWKKAIVTLAEGQKIDIT